MDPAANRRSAELAAVLIAPDRALADQFCRTLADTRSFQILADLRKYPPAQTLEIRLRQWKPEAVLVDLASGLEEALDLIGSLSSFRPAVHIIGLHWSNDPDVVLAALRRGASEFLCAPFEAAVQQEAVAGILRLRQPEPEAEAEAGKVVAFSSAKPGSGASTLACQSALSLRKLSGQRVLLADLDFTGGTAAFYLGLKHGYSLLDVLDGAELPDKVGWASVVKDAGGVSVLPAPAAAREVTPDPDRFRLVIEQAKRHYDWLILDLPSIFHRMSLTALAECDISFLVATPELPSLHLARKAVGLLGQFGIGKDRLKVLVNRVSKGGSMSGSDMEKIFNCPVERCFPNDYISLHKVLALGGPLDASSSLGKTVQDFSGRLAGIAKNEKRGVKLPIGASPAFAGT